MMTIEKMTTYTDYHDNTVELTTEELAWFEAEVERAKKATGLDRAVIIPFDHERMYTGTHKEALGCCCTSDPTNPYECEDTYITIDTYFINETYEGGGRGIIGDSMRETLAHELAHLFVWNHGKKHTALTAKYLELIENYEEDKKEEEPEMKNMNEAWITKYLAKKGKDLFTLQKALMRMTKDEITRRAEEVGYDDIYGGKKAEMVRILIKRLTDKGIGAEKAIPEKGTCYDDPFFKSEDAKYVFFLTQMTGEAKTKALGIQRSHFTDLEAARAWRSGLLKIVHPDNSSHPLAAEAAAEVNRIYEELIAR